MAFGGFYFGNFTDMQDSYSPTSIVQCSLIVEILVDCSQSANLPNKFPAKFPSVHISGSTGVLPM